MGGTYVPARLHVLHGLGAHYPNFIGLAEQHSPMSVRLSASRRGDHRWPTPSVDPFHQRCSHQMIIHSPMSSRCRWAGQVCPGDVLPESVVALPHKRTVYLTLGTLFNGAADFDVPLEALRELPVNVVVTCGYDVDPWPSSHCPATLQLSGGCLGHCCCQGAAPSSATPGRHLMVRSACGLPVVCAARFANAAQVTRTGAGITLLPGQVSVESIRDATHRVLDKVLCRRRAQAQIRNRAVARSSSRRRRADVVRRTGIDRPSLLRALARSVVVNSR